MSETTGTSNSNVYFQTAIQGAGNLLAEGASNIARNRNLKLQNKWNKRMMDYQYSKDLEMWNRANLYNSPAEQMKRLKEAGLNPNLVYGNGSVTGNTTGSLPHYNAPSASFDFRPPIPTGESLATIIPMFADLKVRQAQADNIKAQTESTRLENAKKAFDLPYFKTYMPEQWYYKTDKIKSETAKADQEFYLKGAQASVAQEYARVYSEKLALEMTQQRLTNAQEEEKNLFLKYKNEWAKMGITTSDNLFYRIAAKLLMSMGFQGF